LTLITRAAPEVRRQDLTGELLAFPLVIHARRLHGHRHPADHHLPRLGTTVAHYLPQPILTPHLDVLGHVFGDLQFQGRREHPAGTLPGQLIQRRGDMRARLLLGCFCGKLNLHGGVSFPRSG